MNYIVKCCSDDGNSILSLAIVGMLLLYYQSFRFDIIRIKIISDLDGFEPLPM